MSSRRPSSPAAQRRRALVLALAAGTATLLAGGAAQAHAILLESRPTPGATVAAGDAGIVLRFNCRVDHARSRLVLEAGDGAATPLPIDPTSAADALAATARLAPGDYRLRWQVLAVDGHITRGDVRFSVGR